MDARTELLELLHLHADQALTALETSEVKPDSQDKIWSLFNELAFLIEAEMEQTA